MGAFASKQVAITSVLFSRKADRQLRPPCEGSVPSRRGWVLLLQGSVAFAVPSLSRVRLFATPWTAARQASLSITNSRSVLKLMSIKSVMPSSHLFLCHPLQSFPASGSSSMSQLFASGGQSIEASASVLQVNIQDWFPLGWSGLISWLSKGLARVVSNSTVLKRQFFGALPSL